VPVGAGTRTSPNCPNDAEDDNEKYKIGQPWEADVLADVVDARRRNDEYGYDCRDGLTDHCFISGRCGAGGRIRSLFTGRR
jgi:hypothetical protein